MEEKRGKRKRK